MDENRPKRIGSLAVLKFAAVLLIIWYHWIDDSAFNIGERMVEFLFVVSGFLVGYNYYHQGMPTTISFCFKYVFSKLKKFYPLHIFCAIAMMILRYKEHILGFNIYKLQVLLNHVLLLQSWLPYVDAQQYYEVNIYYNGVSWFFSGLLVCYFVTPLLINIIKKKRSLSLPLFALAAIVLALVNYFNMHSNIFYLANTSVVYCVLEYCIGMFMISAFFTLKEKIPQRRIINVLATMLEICLLFFALYIMSALDKNGYAHKTIFVLMFCVVVFVFAFDLGYFSKLCQKIASLNIANIQLEIYLLQNVVYVFLLKILGKFNLILSNWPMFFLTISVLLIVSIAYKILIEGRMADLIDKSCHKLYRKITSSQDTKSEPEDKPM